MCYARVVSDMLVFPDFTIHMAISVFFTQVNQKPTICIDFCISIGSRLVMIYLTV